MNALGIILIGILVGIPECSVGIYLETGGSPGGRVYAIEVVRPILPEIVVTLATSRPWPAFPPVNFHEYSLLTREWGSHWPTGFL